MAYCENCGMQIADDAKFCENCGAPHMQAVSQGAASQQASHSYAQEEPSSQYTYDSHQAQSTASHDYSSNNTYNAGNNHNTQSTYNAGAGYGTGAYTSGPVPAPGFMEAVQTCFSKYILFSGRARRSEYWYFTAFVAIVQLVLGFVGNAIFGTPENGGPNMLQSLFSLAVFLPSTAVFWRRMHDIGKSGLWFLLNLVPCVGQIVLIVFECMDSQPGENQYGMSPKYPE